MVHRTLAATPPAALTVALADEDVEPTAAATTGDAAVGGGGGGAIPVDRRLGLDEDPPVEEAAAAVAGNENGEGKGKGRKRGRSEMTGAGGCSSGEEEERDGVDGERGESGRCPPRGGASHSGRRSGGGSSSSVPPPSLFVAGRPVTAVIDADTGEDVDVPPGCGRRRRRRRQRGASEAGPATTPVQTSAVGRGSSCGRADHLRDYLESLEAGGALREDDGSSWAGARDAGEARYLGRRVKHALVGLFHRGAAGGCSALVEICLQVIYVMHVWFRGRGDGLERK